MINNFVNSLIVLRYVHEINFRVEVCKNENTFEFS